MRINQYYQQVYPLNLLFLNHNLQLYIDLTYQNETNLKTKKKREVLCRNKLINQLSQLNAKTLQLNMLK